MVHNESENISAEVKFDDVADLLPGNENVNIRVKVVRLWRVPAFFNHSETSSVEMVLIDHKGGKIHASIRKQLVSMFEGKIEEGEVYEMSYFSVFPQVGQFRTTLHPYKLLFKVRTKIHKCESSCVALSGMNFTEIGDICAHTHDYEYLVDVIGVMTGMSDEREYIKDGKITKMVIIELTDHSGKCECALFGGYVNELKKKMGKSSSGLPVVVVQFAKIKIFRDKASIQNVMNATRVLINPDIPEVETFKDSIAVHGIEMDTEVPLIGLPARPPLDEDWWYPACKCHKAVVADSGTYYCSICARHVFQVVPRFRVKIIVSDGRSSCVFVLFDAEMSYLMEKSCAYFVAQSKGISGGPHPAEFDNLVGKKMLFAVEKTLQPPGTSDGSLRVKRVCMDSVIIREFCSQGPYSTPTKAVCKTVDLDSDGLSDGGDGGNQSDSSEFLKDLVVTPPIEAEKNEAESVVPISVRRNLNESFDEAAKGQRKKRLRRIKLEDD
ncbi:replication factor A protein [Trifolium repens]|nr:replication factor A protein [Trifolium repens]